MQQTNDDLKQLDDSLGLSQQPNLINQLSQKQSIKFSTLIKKINDEKMIQQRIFLLTNQAMYNIAKRSSLIKSLVSKLINVQSKYTIKRKVPLKQLYGITLSKSKQNGQFVLHITDQNDYRYCADSHQKKVYLLKKLCQVYTTQTGKKLPFYFKDQIVLTEYSTTKSDVKNRVDKKPKEQPVYLTYEDFEDYELPDLNYKLEYCKNKIHGYSNSFVSMKNFKPIFEIQKLQNNITYYTVTTGTLSLKSTLELLKIKSKYLLHPQFVFSTKSKIQLITPFMVGGNLSRKLQQCVKISQELAYFYIAQLILILEEFEEMDIFYGNFCLENTFINENGYLRIAGLNKDIKMMIKDTSYYEIVGYLPYIPPQMIFVKGYTQTANLWKLGVCAYNLLMGHFPFQGNTAKKVYYEILNKKIKPQLPDFLHGLLEKDPTKRIKLNELKNCSKFAQINWEKLKNQTILAPYQPDTSSWKGNLPSIVHFRPLN